jgi:hypothetical protein
MNPINTSFSNIKVNKLSEIVLPIDLKAYKKESKNALLRWDKVLF